MLAPMASPSGGAAGERQAHEQVGQQQHSMAGPLRRARPPRPQPQRRAAAGQQRERRYGTRRPGIVLQTASGLRYLR